MIGSLDELVERIEAAGFETRRNGTAGAMAQCSIHDDRTPSVSITEGEGDRLLIHCHGCEAGYEQLLAGYGIDPGEMPGAGVGAGVTVAAYAEYVGLDVQWLTDTFDIRKSTRSGKPAVKMPYRDTGGHDAGMRLRASLRGNPRMTEPKKVVVPYGVWRLAEFVRTEILLVEGESDLQVAWAAGIPAFGIPGATRWGSDWGKLLGGFLRVLVWREPGDAGAAFVRSIAADVGDRLLVIDAPPETKDLRDLWLQSDGDRGRVREAWQSIRSAARPWAELEAERLEAERAATWAAASHLAAATNILTKVEKAAVTLGLSGEEAAVKLAYLIFISALLDEPLAAVIRSTAASGKSRITKTALALVPPEAVLELTAMSARALAYIDEDVRHRTVLLFEADSVAGEENEVAAMLLRTLISEHKIVYRTVIDGEPKLLEVEGPLALLTTTTRARLESQLETRLLTISADDSRGQTRRVIDATFAEATVELDAEPWHALYRWLAAGERRVTIPYGAELAALIEPEATRMRRDARQIRDLIYTHAVLHQATRQRDDRGRIIATLDDYAGVRDLVAGGIAQAVGAAVHAGVREMVEAFAELDSLTGVTLAELGRNLGIGTEAARSRVRRAGSYIENREERRGHPGRYVVGEALPETKELLPSVEALRAKLEAPYPATGPTGVTKSPAKEPKPTPVIADDRTPTAHDPGQSAVTPDDRGSADQESPPNGNNPGPENGPRSVRSRNGGPLPLDDRGQIVGQLSVGDLELPDPACLYPSHRATDWTRVEGPPRWVCGACHPPVAGVEVMRRTSQSEARET